jgi:hypothetical protein
LVGPVCAGPFFASHRRQSKKTARQGKPRRLREACVNGDLSRGMAQPAPGPDFEFNLMGFIPKAGEAVFIPTIAYLFQSPRFGDAREMLVLTFAQIVKVPTGQRVFRSESTRFRRTLRLLS